jgi:hypothetical protein
MKIVIIAAATGLVLCSAACSSSTGGSGTLSRPPAAGGGTTAGTSSAGAPAGSTPVVGGSGKDANAWCAELDQAGPAVIAAGDPGALPPNWQAKAEALAADAPADIRPDVVTLIKGDEKIINGDANGDTTPEFLAAGRHVVQWLGKNCPGLLQKYNPGLPGAGSATG